MEQMQRKVSSRLNIHTILSYVIILGWFIHLSFLPYIGVLLIKNQLARLKILFFQKCLGLIPKSHLNIELLTRELKSLFSH